MSDEKNQVEVPEVTQPEPTAFATDGLLPEEVKMAEEHGLIKDEKVDESSKEEKEDEHEEQPEPETEEDTDEEETEEEVNESFEDIEKDENKLKKHTPNEQALYWKWKSDKRKRQDAQREAEELKAKFELSQVKDSAYQIKLRKISDVLKSDNVTVEAIQSIIGGEAEQQDAPLTKSDLEKIEAEKEAKRQEEERSARALRSRIELTEEIGKSKYKNFDELTALASEVVQADKTYNRVLQEALVDPEVDEEELVEKVVTFAKINPKYGKKSDKTEKTDVDRAIKNSKKKISSAAVGHGGSKRSVSYEDLTVEDAARLTTEQWSKLPQEVKTRLLMQ